MYRLLIIFPGGEFVQQTFGTDSLREALERHLQVWKDKKTPYAIALETPDGRRLSYMESRRVLKAEDAA